MSDSLTTNDRNNLLRAAIKEHPNFTPMYESLSPRVKQIVDGLMSGNAGFQLVRHVRKLEAEELGDYIFLQALAGGNPLMSPLLTNFVLSQLEIDLDDFGKPDEFDE